MRPTSPSIFCFALRRSSDNASSTSESRFDLTIVYSVSQPVTKQHDSGDQQFRMQRRIGGGDQVHAEKAGRDGADQTEDRDHRQPHDGVRLPAQAVAVEVFVHVVDALFHFGVQRIESEMIGAHLEQCLRGGLFGDVVEPVAVREAQENLEPLADRTFETLDRIGIADFQAFERVHELVGYHQQRGFLEVRDQKQQEMLVPELRQHAGFGVR